MSSFRTDQILERMGQRDPDFRYMAVSDLYNECLKEGFKMDADSENKIVTKLLQMIAEDPSGDVKGMAVKCLAPLSTKVSEKTFGAIIDGPSGLSKNIFSTKKDMEETKDISTIGLKFIIAEVPESATNIVNLILTRLAPKLTEQIQKGSADDTVLFCLDIVNDLLGKWGREMANEQGCFEKLQTSILPHLNSDNSRARKKAIGCIGYLAISLPDTLLNNLTEHLVKQVKSAKNSEGTQTFIQAIAAISRSVGSRLGRHLKDGIMPIIFKHANSEADENDSAELAAACEIKDNCFQVLEALLLRCPKDTDKYLEKIEKLSLSFLVWDPLVNEEYEDDEEMQDFDDDFIDNSGEASLGDDDMSWKVRKASARCLSVIIKTRPEKLQHMYSSALPTVVARIGKEREENVKLDLMSTVVATLEQTAIVSTAEGDARSSSSTLKKLGTLVPDIVKGIQKELVGKSPKTKIGAFQLLKELVKVIPDCLDPFVNDFIPGIQQGLDDKASSPLKIEALAFLRAFMAHKSAAAVFIPQIESVSVPVLNAISDPYYKINAEALRVLTEIVKILASAEGFNPEPHIPPVYEATLRKLQQLDIDQEVKEGAIECSGLLISLLGDKLNESQVNSCLTILVERLSNEVTRLGTVKTIEQIASSKLKIDLASVLGSIIKELSGFLRKKSRPLKQASLSALIALVKGHGKSKAASSSLFEGILKEAAVLVSEQDLHLAHLSLLLTSSIVHASSSSAENVAKLILPNAYSLLKSSLLQGVALQSLLRLFKELVSSKSKKVTYDSLLSGLTSIITPELSRQSFSSIAQCIAVLAANSEAGAKDTINKFVSEVKSAKSDHQKLLAIFSIGEIGTRVDLSGYSDLKKNIVASFESSSEEIKTAASVAFGCIAVGNMAKFLPEILSEIESHPKRKYLLLGSLREVIVRLSETKEGKENLATHFDSLLSLLFQNTAQEEEGTRNVVSECLGKLALINPETVVTQLRERTADANSHTRACVTTAIKFTIFEKSLPVDKVLKEHIGSFLDLLSDPEIAVRKSVMLSLNYVTHHKPKIVRDILGKYLPSLYGETKIKKELIREVDLGPFKHKVDAGIELRQAAFECMYTLLDTCLTRLDLQELITQLVSGLQDEYDIQMLNHLILIRLAKIAGSALSGGIEQLVEPLKTCVTATAKEQAVAQQVERNNELIRSALRAIHSINQIPDCEAQPKFAEFMKGTVTQGTLGQTYAEIVQASTER